MKRTHLALCLAGLACSAPALAGTDALSALQPSVYQHLSVGGSAPALHFGAQLMHSDRVLDGLAARLDPDRHRDAESRARSARSLRAALPALLHLDLSSRRQFSTRLFGSELLGHSPPQLQADGSTSGGWRWSSGKTWLAIGVAATAAAALTLETGGTDVESVENGGSNSNQTSCGVGGNLVPPDPQIGTDCGP